MLTKITQKLIKILTELVLTKKTIILSFYISKTIILINKTILIKIACKIKAIQIITILIFKRFEVIKIIIAKIIVSTTIKTKLLIIQIIARFANLLRKLKCLSNIKTIIISILVYEFKTCRKKTNYLILAQ